jgi:hypothetical protein
VFSEKKLDKFEYPIRHFFATGPFYYSKVKFDIKVELPEFPDRIMVYTNKEDESLAEEKIEKIYKKFGFTKNDKRDISKSKVHNEKGEEIREDKWIDIIKIKYDKNKLKEFKEYITFMGRISDWHWSTTLNLPPYSVPPDEKYLKKIAENKLKEFGLLTGDICFYEIKGNGSVFFRQKVNMIITDEVIGISMYFREGDKLETIYYNIRNWKPYKEYPIKTPEEVLKEIENGEGVLYMPHSNILFRGEIDKFELQYVCHQDEPNNVYLQPIYYIEGKAATDITRNRKNYKERFWIKIPAIKNEYLMPRIRPKQLSERYEKNYFEQIEKRKKGEKK